MRILVKGNNWLGDAVMSLPTLRSLRDMRPKDHVSVLTRKSLADLYRGARYVDGILPYDRPVAAVKEIRRARFDVALILPRSFASALMVFGARIPRRIGYRAEARSFMLTDAVPRDPTLLKAHRVLYFHHLLQALGKPPEPSAPELAVPDEARAWARREMEDGDWIAINPGATYGVAKQWVPERFAEVARSLGRRTVVVGGPAEAELGARVAAQIPGAVSLAGRTSLLQLAAILERAKLLVTNDTGPMHLADAVGTRIVAIFGPTDWIATPPFGKRHTLIRREIDCSPCLRRTCPLGHHHCMKWVTVEEVLKACRRWIS